MGHWRCGSCGRALGGVHAGHKRQRHECSVVAATRNEQSIGVAFDAAAEAVPAVHADDAAGGLAAPQPATVAASTKALCAATAAADQLAGSLRGAAARAVSRIGDGLHAHGIAAAHLRSVGYTAGHLKGMGYAAAELSAGGCRAAELEAAGFEVSRTMRAVTPRRQWCPHSHCGESS